MELERAQKIAEGVVGGLAQYCERERIEVVGSIRRKRPQVNDIDLVLVPRDRDALDHRLMQLGKLKMSGLKIARIQMEEITLDVYYATPETWATLLLIRTGSKENNIRLATLAKKKAWHLAASGDGLFNERGQRIAGDTEESIYEALGLRYEEPWERG
ncbi:hypothetical protein ES703_109663 [subsurface metagenome]